MFQSPLSIVCISALIATAVNDRATLIPAMNEFITFFTIYLRFRVQRKRRSQTWCIAFVATWSSFLTNVDLDENSCDTLNDRKALFIWHRWWCLRPQWNDMRQTQIFCDSHTLRVSKSARWPAISFHYIKRAKWQGIGTKKKRYFSIKSFDTFYGGRFQVWRSLRLLCHRRIG